MKVRITASQRVTYSATVKMKRAEFERLKRAIDEDDTCDETEEVELNYIDPSTDIIDAEPLEDVRIVEA